jgi:hypothetical protein
MHFYITFFKVHLLLFVSDIKGARLCNQRNTSVAQVAYLKTQCFKASIFIKTPSAPKTIFLGNGKHFSSIHPQGNQSKPNSASLLSASKESPFKNKFHLLQQKARKQQPKIARYV